MTAVSSRQIAVWTTIGNFCLLLLAAPAWADRTLYVAKHGADDNPGTEARPWLTIGKAADTLVAGDTVYIQAGTYRERVVPQNSGTPRQSITYAAYPGHKVTVDGSGIKFGWPEGLFQIKNKSGIKLSGMRIVNSAFFGVSVAGNASHIVIENNCLRHCQSSGISVWTHKRASTITDLVIAGNEVTDTNLGGDQEGISVCGVDRFEIRDNHVHHIHKEGIDAKEGCTQGKICQNYVHHMLGFKQNGVIVSTVGIYVDTWGHTRDIEVSANITHNCGSGFAVASETGDPCENVRFVNNLAYHNQDGFVVGWSKPGPKDIAIINNVSYANARCGIRVEDEKAVSVVVRNNICSQNREAQIAVPDPVVPSVVVDHNLIDGYRGHRTTWKGRSWQEVCGDNAVRADPRFMNPIGGDFHLKPNSPALDKGSAVGAPSTDCDGNRRPQGRGVDMGAYEPPGNPPS